LKKKFEDVDFTDPIDKWLWFGIAALAIGLAIALVGAILGSFGGFFSYISGLFGLAGVIFLIIWLVKVVG